MDYDMTDYEMIDSACPGCEELEKVVDELSVLVRRLAYRLKKIDNNSELSAQAMGYLARNNLTGMNGLREEK